MLHRLHIYIYALIYPAVLGSLIFAGITRTGLGAEQGWAAALMAFYFLVQYGEGMVATSPKSAGGAPAFGWARFAQDSIEIFVLILVFGSLGFFEPVSAGGTGSWLAPLVGWHWLLMIAALSVPRFFRWVRREFEGNLGELNRPSQRERDVGRELSFLSTLAIFGCLIGLVKATSGLIIVTGSLSIYFVCFVAGWVTLPSDEEFTASLDVSEYTNNRPVTSAIES